MDQNGMRSGSGYRTWPDANVAPPVYRVDLTRPVKNVEHGKAVSQFPPWPVQGKSTARQTQGRRHGEDRRSQSRPVIGRICPRRSGLTWQECPWNHLESGTQMTSDARRLVHPKLSPDGAQPIMATGDDCQAFWQRYSAVRELSLPTRGLASNEAGLGKARAV